MKRSNWFNLFMVLAILPMLMNCSKVPAGNVGIKFYLLGGSKGVDYEALSPGRYWIGINEELYQFPVFTQNIVWTKNETEGSPNDESITFQTSEGLAVSANIGVTYHLKKSEVPKIFEKYKKGIDEITDVYLRNMVRDAFVQSASTKPVESVYGKGKTELLKEVESIVKNQTEPIGIMIDKVYLVGQMVLPKTVIAALNRKITATQKAEQRENELREAEAEAKKKVANAKGVADSILMVAESQANANIKLSKSINENLVQYKSIEKWDGQLPHVSGQATPFINIK